MAKYDFTNVTPFNEQPLYKQGYEDAIDKACEWLEGNILCMQNETRNFFIERFRKAMEDTK